MFESSRARSGRAFALLLLPVRDPAARQIVRRQLQLHAIARQDADAELAHLPARVGEDRVLVVELDAIVATRELLADGAFDFDACFLLRHESSFALFAPRTLG